MASRRLSPACRNDAATLSHAESKSWRSECEIEAGKSCPTESTPLSKSPMRFARLFMPRASPVLPDNSTPSSHTAAPKPIMLTASPNPELAIRSASNGAAKPKGKALGFGGYGCKAPPITRMLSPDDWHFCVPSKKTQSQAKGRHSALPARRRRAAELRRQPLGAEPRTQGRTTRKPRVPHRAAG